MSLVYLKRNWCLQNTGWVSVQKRSADIPKQLTSYENSRLVAPKFVGPNWNEKTEQMVAIGDEKKNTHFPVPLKFQLRDDQIRCVTWGIVRFQVWIFIDLDRFLWLLATNGALFYATFPTARFMAWVTVCFWWWSSQIVNAAIIIWWHHIVGESNGLWFLVSIWTTTV